MEALRSLDLRAAIEFVETAWALADEHAFTTDTISALGELIPCDYVAFCDLDRVHKQERRYVGIDTAVDTADDDDLELFWRIVDEHPLCRHQLAYMDFAATRLSDVISRRRLVNSRIWSEWFRPFEIEAMLEMGIARSRARTRNFILERARGDFSERDRAILELLRPHLSRIHEMAELRRQARASDPPETNELTDRETEILELVSVGLTNAAIAERLWISPGTVKKHLENVYAKLGVGNRTAAVARISPR